MKLANLKRSTRLLILLGVLLVACIAALVALQYEQQREDIQTSGATILSIDSAAVESLSWEYEGQSFAFHKDDGTWLYDEDEAFPVDDAKLNTLLEPFEDLGATFVIENAEDVSLYGLDDPMCTITVQTADQTYDISLGDYSTMDSQRYLSIGDGNVYLAASDPAETYAAGLSDLIANDTLPAFLEVETIAFSGAQNYEIFYEEDSSHTYCSEDVYFTEQDGQTLPLDTTLVEDYLGAVSNLTLSDYVTYNATDEELQSYGLDDPDLTLTVRYTDDGDAQADSECVLHISRDPSEQAEASADGEEEDPSTITAYARVGESQIVYQITGDSYQTLLDASYDDLRHHQIFSGEFADITQIDISLEDEAYSLTTQGSGDDRTFYFEGEEIDSTDLADSLTGLTAASFTDEAPTLVQEIGLTLHLDNENFPQVTIALYRYDGEQCLAVVDDTPTALVPRSSVVDLIEAVHAIVI